MKKFNVLASIIDRETYWLSTTEEHQCVIGSDYYNDLKNDIAWQLIIKELIPLLSEYEYTKDAISAMQSQFGIMDIPEDLV
jgi:hypothetical protein